MTRALFSLLIVSVLGLTTGCHVCHGIKNLHHKIQGQHQQGCCNGCSDGACTCESGACAGGACTDGCCGPDGHPDPYEPLHYGYQGPAQRGGVLSWLGRANPPSAAPIPEQAMPAPGPSAGNVSYPYYTTRGPRDFLSANPRGIGPNY